MRKILLICNDSNNVINFRKDLIIHLINSGYDVSVIASDDKRKIEIESLGVSFSVCKYKNRSINPFAIKSVVRSFIKVIRTVEPDIIFTFQIKPNILGNRAARKTKINKVYSMVEGLGDPFDGNDLGKRILRLLVCRLYKKEFKRTNKVFFLNEESRDEFLERKLINKEQSVVIPGIGINVNQIKYDGDLPGEKGIVLLSRLIRNKGIMDYCEIAREVRKQRPDIHFYLYGDEYDVTMSDLKPFIDGGSIVYKGYTNNPIEVIEQNRIFVTCSFYKEGLPRTILEAMAVGRPTIATNIVGCKDAVIDGKTGYLLEPHDIERFANKIIDIIDNDKLLLELGKNAREVCEKKFDSKKINSKIVEIISE